jgi:uncharacterized protein HemX
MQKTKPESNVIPFTGYLHPEVSPPTTSPKSTATPLFTAAVLLFVGGLALGAISVYQSVDYTQMEALKAQSKQLSQLKSDLCGN